MAELGAFGSGTLARLQSAISGCHHFMAPLEEGLLPILLMWLLAGIRNADISSLPCRLLLWAAHNMAAGVLKREVWRGQEYATD